MGYLDGQYQDENGNYGSAPRGGEDTKDRYSNYEKGTVVNHPSLYHKPPSNTEQLSTGLYVSVKTGMTINYYQEPNLNKMVGPSGGKGGQSIAPYREKMQNVGVTTGRLSNGFVEVDWVNEWWQDASWDWWKPFAAIEKGEYKKETKRSWVELSKVDVAETFVSDKDKQNGVDENKDSTPPPFVPTSSNFLSDNMLGIAALGIAFVASKGKKKRRR